MRETHMRRSIRHQHPPKHDKNMQQKQRCVESIQLWLRLDQALCLPCSTNNCKWDKESL